MSEPKYKVGDEIIFANEGDNIKNLMVGKVTKINILFAPPQYQLQSVQMFSRAEWISESQIITTLDKLRNL